MMNFMAAGANALGGAGLMKKQRAAPIMKAAAPPVRKMADKATSQSATPAKQPAPRVRRYFLEAWIWMEQGAANM